MKNMVKEMIQCGKKALGTFYELGGVAAVECLGIAGLDFLIIDTEHGPYDVESSLQAINAAEKANITPFVRVKDSTRPSVLKMLDAGAKGLIIPCIESVAEVEKLVEYGKYYPVGRRGFAPVISSSFGYADFATETGTYFNACNAETLIIPQCETRGCLDHIEEIASIQGVDGIFVGPYDLSVALGRPADMQNPELMDAISYILSVCKAKHKISMIYAGNVTAAKQKFSQGFDCVACGMDAIGLIEYYKKLVSDVKA